MTPTFPESATPSFLDHLCETFGWTPEEATRALGEWMLSTEAGQHLRSPSARERSGRSSLRAEAVAEAPGLFSTGP